MDIQEFLQSRKIPFQVMLHRPMPSASRRARSLHISGHWVAKTVLIWADNRFVLAVLPATYRIDLDQFAEVLGFRAVRLATEEEAQQVFFDCERGALPPFGRLYGLETIVDASLSEASEIVVEANLRHEDMRLRYRDFITLEDPVRARFAISTLPGPGVSRKVG
ncbi:YbaK/EbsC family protein [soil metagenome]